jgi:uncharacterized surface protein with fasciclin (FAS1) repeats
MKKLTFAVAVAAATLLAAPSLAMNHGDHGGGKTIVDVAAGAGQFNTLVAAVKAAGLVDTLKAPGPFTVFAPTDAAFAKLPPGMVDNLLRPENKAQLTSILTFHVVPGRTPASAVAGKKVEVTTVNGAPLAVDGTGNGVRVGPATVVAADVAASNGVIHAIDTVLIPPRR